MSTSQRMKVLTLYKLLLRESGKFTSYNYRTYAQRRVRDAFRENRSTPDTAQISTLIQNAEKNVEVIRRQVMIGQLYEDLPMILEAKQDGTQGQ